MNIAQKKKIQEISRFFLLVLSIFSGVTLAISPSQAANIKEWKLDFFDESGNSVGSGNFSYDLDTTTLINTLPFDPDPSDDPSDFGFFVQTELISFSANVLGVNWSLSDREGQLWWEPSSNTVISVIFPRGGSGLEQDLWFFGDAFFNEDAFAINGSSPGTWGQVTDFGPPVGTENFGTWTATQVPEPLTILGTGLALGFGIKFKTKKNVLARFLEKEG